MVRILGLDLGIASIGWSVVDIGDNEINFVDTGVRVFDSAENAKTKASSAEPRRLNRLCRRRLKRRRIRIAKVKEICEKYLNVKAEDLYKDGVKGRKDVWELRKEALERKLEPQELARVLVHITKHRGWKSNRKSEESEGDSGKMKKAITELQAKLGDGTTAGAYYGAMGRNTKIKNTKDKYDHSIGRDTNRKEIEVVFEKQDIKDEIFKKEVLECFDYQKEIQSMLAMVGDCKFESGEKRAPKESYAAEIFNVYTKLINLLHQNKIEFEPIKFEKCVKLFLDKKDVKFKHIREAMELPASFRFDGLKYNNREYFVKKDGKFTKTDEQKIAKYTKEGWNLMEFEKDRTTYCYFINSNKEYKCADAEDKVIYNMKGYHKIKDITTNQDYIDTIYQALCYEKSDERSKAYMCENGVPEEIAEKALSISSNDFIHLSIKAIQKLLPFLKQGRLYNEACESAGYDFKKTIQNKGLAKLPILEGEYLPKNPVVKRTMAQTRKIVNAIRQKYGGIEQVNIEFTRELGKSADERNKIEKRQRDSEQEKINNKNEVQEILVREPSDTQCLKYRMYKQQDGKSLYSMEAIDLRRLLDDDKYCEIDHIIPYSKTFDDSLNNKCLVLASDNQNKRNRTPYEFLREKIDWENWKQQVWAIGTLPYTKRKNLTCEEPNYDKWKSRNLNDTSYLSRLVKKYLEENLQFKENERIKNKVQVRPGILTASLRHQLGIGKVRSDSDTHHSVDACVIALATQKMCQQISTWNANKKQGIQETINDKCKELEQTKEAIKRKVRNENDEEIEAIEQEIARLKEKAKDERCNALENFSEELKANIREQIKNKVEILTKTDDLSDLSKVKIVSRMPRRGITGEAHKETINKKEKIATKKNIDLSDPNVDLGGIEIRKGIAQKGGIPRVDIYKTADDYGAVSIFISDFIKDLPTKNYNEKDFIFSLWKDEPIYIETNKGAKYFGYLKQIDLEKDIIIEKVDKSQFGEEISKKTKTKKQKRIDENGEVVKDENGKAIYDEIDVSVEEAKITKKISLTTIKTLKKYQVSPLGSITLVKKEKRLGTKKK